MQFNVSQLLQDRSGSVKRYQVEEEISGLADTGPVRVTGTVSMMKTDLGIQVTADLEAKVSCSCVRCLTSFHQSQVLKMEEEFLPISEVRADPFQDELITYDLIIDEQHLLDMEPAVREYLALGVPMKPLCREGCAGLCAQCGASLNEGECLCSVTDLKTA
jgi:uncharacterized protein